MLKGELAFVFQPLHAVIGLEDKRLIENVAVDVQHVEITVAVHVNQLNAARPVGGMRGRENRLLAKTAIPFVDESDDRPVLLTDEGDKIRPAIFIQIADRDVDRAMAVVEDVRRELRLRPVRGPIFQVDDFAGEPPAENANDQVQLAVAVEIRGLNIGDSADSLKKVDRLESAVGLAA